MRKKLFAMYALAGALVASPIFTSCVDDSESASVEALRGAKAEQLSALATLQKAQAEAAKVTADAEKAYKEAWAEYYRAQANNENANTDKVLQEMEQAKAKFEYEIAYIKADYDKKIAEAKRDALKAEQEILANAEAHLATLYSNYSSAVTTLNNLKFQKAEKEMLLTEYEAGAVALDEVILQEKNDLEAQIAEAEAKIKAWETYQGIDEADLDAELLAAQQAKYAAFAAKEAAEEATEKPEEAAEEVLAQYDLDDLEEPSTVAAVAAIQKFQKLMPMGNYGFADSWEYNDINEAREGYYAKVENGDLPYIQGAVDRITTGGYYDEDGNWQWGWVITNQFVVDGNVYDPFNLNNTEEISDNVYVPLYKLKVNNEDITKISQGLVADKEKYAEQLGAAATETTEATGYYKNLADAEKELEDFQKDLADAKEDLTAGEAEVEAAQAKVDEAQAAVDAEQAKIDAEQDKIDAANAVIATADSNKDYAATEKSTYVGLKSAEETNKTTAETNKTTAEANKAAATTDEEKAAADAEIAAATAAIADATAKIEAYTAKIEAAEDAIEAAEKTIEAEDAKIAAANKAIADITVALKEAERKLEHVETMELDPAQNKVTTAEGEITTAESNIKSAEQKIASCKDNIEKAINYLADADEILAAWEAVVAELSGDKFTAYEKEVKELAANETVAAWLALEEAADEADKAYTEAETLVTTLTNAIANGNVHNAAEEIADLKETIAGLKLDIAELETTRMNISTEYTWTDNVAASYLDRAIEELKANIASLEDEIAIQEEVVAFRKAALDEYLASGEGESAE